MISISGKKWIERIVKKNSIEKTIQDYNFSQIISKLIISRKFDLTEIYNIKNILEIKNVFSNNDDFNNGINLLTETIKNKEKICILGDYDVDGSASTSLFIRFLNSIKHPYFYYIPDREKDGYGATKKLFKKLILQKPKLLIMVDCGSNSNEAVNFLNENNVKSIIIDHHEINKPFPKSNVLINPKKNNGYEKFDYLCATTLVYFLLDLLIKKNNFDFKLSDFLIYVLLATVCDVMPLRELNRQIAKYVMNVFDIKKNVAFNTLFKLGNKKNKFSIDDLGFYIGPIINAGGRLGNSNYGTELLSSDNQEIITIKSNKLILLNDKRKIIEKKILDKIDFNNIKKENKNVIILYEHNINEGLIGIIASRLKDYFDKPSIVLTNSGDYLKASARSTSNYNIGNLIKTLVDKKVILKGGGHNMAAGFVIQKDNLQILDNFIQKDYLYKIPNPNYTNYYDFEISSSALNLDFINEIKKIGPFGNKNPLPMFFLKDLKIIKVIVLNKKHITSILKPKNSKSIKSICFNSINTKIGEYLMSYKNKISVIGQINENIWNNKKTLQLTIRDLIL